MEEKILIQSVQYNTKDTMKKIIYACLGIIAFAVILYIFNFDDCHYGHFSNSMIDVLIFSMGSDFLHIVFCIGLDLLLLTLLVNWWLRSYNLTVTDKRVYGNTSFGKQVDLPVDSISAISTSMLKGIAVATSSGKIVFKLIKNRDEMRIVINSLIIDRQKNNASDTKHNDLVNLKDLLDKGVISQEEFNAKKKQLLGL